MEIEPLIETRDAGTRMLEMKSALERSAGKRVTLHMHACARGTRVRTHGALLERVYAQLAAHGHDTMPHGGHLTLETLAVDVDGESPWHPQVPAGRWVLIAASTAPYANQPSRIDASLTALDQIVREEGGVMNVAMAAGGGTRVKIYLPRADARPLLVPRAILAAA